MPPIPSQSTASSPCCCMAPRERRRRALSSSCRCPVGCTAPAPAAVSAWPWSDSPWSGFRGRSDGRSLHLPFFLLRLIQHSCQDAGCQQRDSRRHSHPNENRAAFKQRLVEPGKHPLHPLLLFPLELFSAKRQENQLALAHLDDVVGKERAHHFHLLVVAVGVPLPCPGKGRNCCAWRRR